MNSIKSATMPQLEQPVASIKKITAGNIFLLGGLLLAFLVPVLIKDPSHQNLAILVLMAAQLVFPC